MRRMGIPDDYYTDILTSGEAVRRALRRPPDLWWAELGQRVFHLGPERDRGIIEGLPLEKVALPGEANFVLNTGPDDHRNPTDINEFEAVLQDCEAASPADDMRQSRPACHPWRRSGVVCGSAGIALPGNRRRCPFHRQARSGGLSACVGAAGPSGRPRARGRRCAAHRYCRRRRGPSCRPAGCSAACTANRWQPARAATTPRRRRWRRRPWALLRSRPSPASDGERRSV